MSHHPFQRLGARAAAILTGRAEPGDITDTDLDALVDRVVADSLIAARAERGGPGWVWLARLSAMYPNSPATHPTARAKPAAEQRLRDLFVPDGAPQWWCQMCQQAHTSVRWDKSRTPLGHSREHVNYTFDSQSGGDPTCRRCRIALWCLPYTVDHAGGQIWSIDTMSPALEKATVTRLVTRAKTITGQKWTTPAPDHNPRDGLVDDLLAHPAPVTVYRWNNDNRGATMDAWTITEESARWLQAVRQAGYWPVLTTLGGKRHPLHIAENSAQVLTHQLANLDAPMAAMPALHALEASLSRMDPHLLEPGHLAAFTTAMNGVPA